MRILLRTALILIAIASCMNISYAQENVHYLVAETTYFTVYGFENMGAEELLKNLNYNFSIHPESLLDSEKIDQFDLEGVLKKSIDALFKEVSDILSLQVHSFHGTIEVFRDQASINAEFQNITAEEFNEGSFYLHNNNTIYISLADMTLGMIGHEIAHAIISHYFVTPPPNKVQEVLAGYVEFNLQKSALE